MKKFSDTLTASFQKQIKHEFFASNAYLHFSNWLEHNKLRGGAAFFQSESIEERAHGRETMKYLLGRNVMPVVENPDFYPSEIPHWKDIYRLYAEIEA